VQELLFRAGRIGFDPQRSRGGLILCLHDVAGHPVSIDERPFSISASMLDELVRWIRNLAEVVPIGELLDRPNGSRLRCAFVFDDAGRSLLDHARPVMAAHDAPWAVAVPTARVGLGYADPILRLTHALAVTRADELAVRGVGRGAVETIRLDGRQSRAALVKRVRDAQFEGRHDEALATVDALVEAMPGDDPGRTYPEDLRISDERELGELATSPVTFLSHGHQHLPLAAMSPAAAAADWVRSVEWLRERFPANTDGRVLVLPYGRTDDAHASALREAGCRFALSGIAGLHLKAEDFNVVPRVAGHARRMSVLAARIAGAVRTSSR
jgi:peptidoglycan/xylan/chitin deacetylase (PgdA/CDA1 family)